MREFTKILLRFVPPYKGYVMLSALLNLLSALANIFSFAALIPILQIIFRTEDIQAATRLMPWDWYDIHAVLENNMSYMIGRIIATHGHLLTLVMIGAFVVITTLIKTALYFSAQAVMVPLQTGMMRDMRNQIYSRLTHLPMSFFSRFRSGEIVARITGDVTVVENSIMASLDMMFKQPILIISYFLTLLVISWQLTFMILLFVPLMSTLMGRIGRKLRSESTEAQKLWGQIISIVQETLSGQRIIRNFCAQERMDAHFRQTSQKHYSSSVRVGIRQSLAHPVSEFLGTMVIVLVILVGGYLVLNMRVMTGAIFIYYIVILYSIINPLKDLSKAGYTIPVGLASMERIDAILGAADNIPEASQPIHKSSFEDSIEFRNVSFRYDENWVLRDLNLVVRKGETVALVGQSGSGKSTLLDLLSRLWDVEQGEILIDGINIKDIAIHDLRSLFAAVNQDAVLFNDTIEANIRFGKTDASAEDILLAARRANAHDFIMTSENGFDTIAGDRGQNLSGGQRQRISIARAILRDPSILILDEATSALDAESELQVQNALDELMKGRTTIAVAHRLSTIQKASRIYVLHEGRIVEEGTHQELLAQGGRYAQLYALSYKG